MEIDLPEINAIFDELLIIKDKFCINKLIIAGDTFDKINPTAKELDCFSSFLKKINLPIILLIAKSHESISQEESILNHFGILKENIITCSEYQDGKNLYVGHFTLNESKFNYGTKRSKKEFAQFKHVILGHQHDFQVIKPNICHIGAIRYIDFSEDETLSKKIAICENYGEKSENWQFINLFSPYPLQNIIVKNKNE